MSQDRSTATNRRLAERLANLARADGVLAIPGLQSGLLDAIEALVASESGTPSSAAETEVMRNLIREAESFVNLAMARGHDVREDAPRAVRNAIAAAKLALEGLRPHVEEKP